MGLETFEEQTELIQKEFGHIKKRKLKKQLLGKLKKLNSKVSDSMDCRGEYKFRRMELNYSFEKNFPNDVLVKKRNDSWLKILPSFFKRKNCFLVVGYEHLKYKCGLIQSLKLQGFEIEPIEIMPVANMVYN